MFRTGSDLRVGTTEASHVNIANRCLLSRKLRKMARFDSLVGAVIRSGSRFVWAKGWAARPEPVTTMNPRRSARPAAGLGLFLALFLITAPGMPADSTSIPQEPEEYDDREVTAYYDWRNDMFFRQFDMAGLGKIDFMTARRTYKVWMNEFGNPVALTMANPLFYWVDLDSNGEFEPRRGEMWSDPEEDGVNGNETPYDVQPGSDQGPPVYPFRPRSEGP